jgi:TonB family protein
MDEVTFVMAFRTGRCTNDLYCSFASARQDLQVPADAKFLCPHCGKPLSEPSASARGGPMRMAVIAGGGLALTGGALFVVGSLFGHAAPGAVPPASQLAAASPAALPPAAPHATVTSSRAPAATQAAASGAPPANAPPAAPAAFQAPAQSPVPPPRMPSTPAEGTPALAAAGQTAGIPANVAATSPAAPPTASTPHPETIPAAARSSFSNVSSAPGQPAPVRVAMIQPAMPAPTTDTNETALAARKADDVRRAAAAKAALAAQQDDARRAAAAQAAQQQAAQQAAQRALFLEQKRKAQQQKESALAETEAEAPKPVPAAPAPKPTAPMAAPVAVAAAVPHPQPAPKAAGPTRSFSATPLAGGAPAYPASYDTDGRAGRVTVSCTIEANGTPSGCHVLATNGGAAFGSSVMSWLKSGRVRYAPVLHDGQPVAETHQWTMNFQP